jgi:hypothetical protein
MDVTTGDPKPAHVRSVGSLQDVSSFPLSVAGHIAIALDCLRRGDLDGAASALTRAAALSKSTVG